MTAQHPVTTRAEGDHAPSDGGASVIDLPSRPSFLRRAGAAVRRYWPTALLLVILVLFWQWAVSFFDVPDYVFASPSQIWTSITENWSDVLASATWTTLSEVLIGFGLSVAIGIGVATALHWSRVLRRVVYPLLIASQTVPIVVIAPILAIIFGYSLLPKVLLVALVCFFPIVVNTLDGLASTDPQLLRVMRTLDGTRWGAFTRIEFPASLPSMFSGLRVAATYAAIGAVFGEYGGSQNGLGYVIIQATPQLQTGLVFASILLLSIMSMLLFLAVSLVERFVAPWAREGTTW